MIKNTVNKSSRLNIIVFLGILAIGFFARTWEFNHLPLGLHQDEAGLGIDAYDVMHFDYDRNGMSYPLQFITWGDGETVLYSYATMPFIALFGLSTLAIRLPNLIAGILIIPLVFLIGKRAINTNFGLICMFLMAISPWNIIGSRWGIQPYLLPFMFSVGFYFLLLSELRNYWLIPASVFFALCLYTYSTAFAAVPVFLLLAAVLFLIRKLRINRPVILALFLFILLASPIAIYIIINTFDLNTVYLGRFSIPHLPIEPRFQIETGIYSSTVSNNYFKNFLTLVELLWSQTDHWPRNVIEPFGYLYPFASLLAISGFAVLFLRYRKNFPDWLVLIMAWFLACLPIGILQKTNFNRICLIFLPITFLVAYFHYFIKQKNRFAFGAILFAYLIGFSLFTAEYHSPAYTQNIARDFNVGFIDAIQYARRDADTNICFSRNITASYVYVLFLEKPDPRSYIPKLGSYVNGANPFPAYSPLFRYKFREDRCPQDGKSIKIIRSNEAIPQDGIEYGQIPFKQFIVLIPKN